MTQDENFLYAATMPTMPAAIIAKAACTCPDESRRPHTFSNSPAEIWASSSSTIVRHTCPILYKSLVECVVL